MPDVSLGAQNRATLARQVLLAVVQKQLQLIEAGAGHDVRFLPLD